MLSWFGPRESLPGRGSGRYEQSDTATFREIWGAARLVERNCLLPTRRPGWDAVGEDSQEEYPKTGGFFSFFSECDGR